MFGLFYVLVLSVPVIDCISYAKGNLNFNKSNRAYRSLTPNSGTLHPVGRLTSLSGSCPTDTQRADSTLCRERTVNNRKELEGLPSSSSLQTDESTPRDVDESCQRPSASNGTVSQAGRQFPPAREIMSSAKNESSNGGNSRNLSLFSFLNPNKFWNKSLWMHEEYEAHDEGNSSDNFHYIVRLDTMNVTQKINRLVENYFRSHPNCQNGDIKFCKDVSGEFLKVNLRDVRSQPGKRLGTSANSAPCNESNFRMWLKNNAQLSHEQTAEFVVDDVVCFLALPLYDQHSEFLSNSITLDEEYLRLYLHDLGSHVIRVHEFSEFRLESHITITSINNILTYFDILFDDIAAFEIHFNHDIVAAARLKLNECRRQFRELENICYELLDTPYRYTPYDRRGMADILHEFTVLSDEFTVLVKDMIQALAAHEESVH